MSRLSHLSSLEARIARIAAPAQPRGTAGLFATGHAVLDQSLGGGLAQGAVHELFAGSAEDAGSAAGFALALAWQAHRERRLIWLRSDAAERRTGQVYAPGLAELGLDPARLILGRMPDEVALLRAATDALRCAALGAVVIECPGKMRTLDLTASRRLALAARASGVTALLVRSDADPVPSAAETRWSVSAAASVALEAQAPGAPRFEVELLRRRSGPAGIRWCMEWDRNACVFREAARTEALPGAVVSLSERRPAQPVSA
ncbi:ImuA family protein [Sphingomonas zeicaulis]|uniref:ImuA family protein n=1 Tax=Sphingomonas zeicaulis TaxID=1632740 RepID=UPI003D1D41F1